MAGTTADGRAPETTFATASPASATSSKPPAGPPASGARRAPEVFLRLITAIHSVLPGFVRRRLPVTFIGYAIINGSAFILDIICLRIFNDHLHWWFPMAVTVGYAIAGVYSFLLNRWLNFQSHGHVVEQGAGYTVGLVSQYVVFILGLSTLLHWLGMNATLARVISACCEGIYLYVFIRLWVFRGTPEPKRAHR
ncbi:GtrA family protein [Actinomyces viscosus]|uniref:GtrA-like protein n=1 Tax=Actinomyces viscosus TaxID=1656 RepID=A0A3S4X9U4_ACTVI|nr:GtrA family protein [Actinomyces viscosus]TFH51949.1 GtrA family protein [Actinomyces viscosus]VEI16474.1 GtrA-like protein [Actinomyces viscosus]